MGAVEKVRGVMSVSPLLFLKTTSLITMICCFVQEGSLRCRIPFYSRVVHRAIKVFYTFETLSVIIYLSLAFKIYQSDISCCLSQLTA